MNTFFLKQVRLAIVGVCSIAILLLFSACSGVASSTGTGGTIVGKIQSISAVNHSVVVNVNGQNITVSNLTDQQIAGLQTQVGKTYSFQVQAAQNSTNSYTINSSTDPTETDNATPIVNVTEPSNNGVNTEPGSLSFIGKVQQVNSGNITIAMPNGQTLSMAIVNGQSELSTNGGTLPAVNTMVKASANANTDGSFTLSKLETIDASDAQDPNKLNTVDMQGITTQAVGSDNVVHIKVGSKSFAFALTANSELKNFANAQAIATNQAVKIEVLFNGSNGSIVKIENSNG
ncbi:MAG: hypothetical protein PVS3B3_32090 [Ktedonobacteraceae bacterium]